MRAIRTPFALAIGVIALGVCAAPSVLPLPTSLVLGDLIIAPTTVMAGEGVTYSIQVSNVGATAGAYTLVFRYKTSTGTVGSDKAEVALEPGQTKTVMLTVIRSEPGTYFVAVDGKRGQYTVTSPRALEPFARQTGIEVVTRTAATVNRKGGNQTRIVRTQDGVFTAYIVEGGGEFSHEWRLARRQPDGTWAVIAQGDAGAFPVSLLASPDGTLHIIGWSHGVGMIWSGRPKNGALALRATSIPDAVQGDYPYPSAGIDAIGNLCVLTSREALPDLSVKDRFMAPQLRCACYLPSQSQWVTQSYNVDYRYTYSYVFPGPDGHIAAVSTRDCGRAVLGIAQPPGRPPWVFNAFMYWGGATMSSDPFHVLSFAEELPTARYADPWLAIHEAYLDSKGRMHIIYSRFGETTDGRNQNRHRIVSSSGITLFDEELPEEAGQQCRVFQDRQERFYLLGQSGLLYPMDQEGQRLGAPMQLDLEGHEVQMFGLSVPRGGTPLSDVMGVGFVGDDGTSWFYFELDFSSR